MDVRCASGASPCAGGEEPLTLAMMLEEARWFDRAPIEIVGSDASRAAVGRAERGRYGPRAFRNLSPALREKYFTQDGDHWIVDPGLRRRVSYDVVNLVAPDEVARHADAPIVFCRNVFIYFSEQSIRRTLDAMSRHMPDPAYLCVGASRIAAAAAFGVRPGGNRRGVHVRQGEATPRSGCRHPSARSKTRGSDGPRSVCSSSMIRRTSGKSSRKCCLAFAAGRGCRHGIGRRRGAERRGRG